MSGMHVVFELIQHGGKYRRERDVRSSCLWSLKVVNSAYSLTVFVDEH